MRELEKKERERMVLLLGLCRETNKRMIEAVKEFWEKMWRARCWDNQCTGYYFSACLFFSSTGVADPKALERS